MRGSLDRLAGSGLASGAVIACVDLHEPGCVQYGYWGCLIRWFESALTAVGWALWIAGLWLVLNTEQQEKAARNGHRHGRSCGGQCTPLGAPKPHAFTGSVVDGRPGEQKRGKADAASGTLGLGRGRCARRTSVPPVT